MKTNHITKSVFMALTLSITIFFTQKTNGKSLEQSTTSPFITTWKTDNPGISNSTSITIPAFGSNSYDVDWDNDGIYDQFNITGYVTHDFLAPGTYTIRIKGDFPRIYFNNTGDKDKLLSVEQWGDFAWTNMERFFYGCSNLINNATDARDLTNVFIIERMFMEASSL